MTESSLNLLPILKQLVLKHWNVVHLNTYVEYRIVFKTKR